MPPLGAVTAPLVSVVIPWCGGCPHRERARAWVTARYEAEFPSWEIVAGQAPPGPWCKAAAVADALTRARGDVLAVADADVWTPGVGDAVEAVREGADWAVPHHLVHRLADTATADVLDGGPVDGRPGRSRMLRLTQRPYAGVPGGGLVVLTRDLYEQAPLDARFAGWGGEDHAWGYALTALAGRPWRATSRPLWHLWHPPQPRLTRQVGSAESEALRRRYAAARRDVAAMRALIDEAKEAASWLRESGSTIARSAR